MILLEMEKEIDIVMNRGAIFCHVARIIHLVHEILDIICGSQKWKGAAPILMKRAKIRVNKTVLYEKIENEENKIDKDERRIREEPRA